MTMDSASASNGPLDMSECEKNLKNTLKLLASTERKLEKAQRYNQQLVTELEELKRELHTRRKTSKNITYSEKSTQTDYSVTSLPDQSQDLNNTFGQTVSESVYEPLTVEASTGDGNALSIADQLRSVAEQAVSQSGYTYDEVSGLYYDQQTGYYYNPENKLYYDSTSCCYYTFNEEGNCYEFHSHADLSQYEQYYKHQSAKAERLARKAAKQARRESRESRLASKESRKRCTNTDEIPPKKCLVDDSAKESDDDAEVDVARQITNSQSENSSEPEDGEVVSSDEESCLGDADVAPEQLWRPPCVRAVVKASDTLDIGSLHVVTINGGNIGSDGTCTICIPEEHVNETHCKLVYSNEERCYYIVELGSKSGTFLNSTRLSQSGESSSCRLSNRDCLRVGTTELVLHIHPGTDTCSHCEPGVIESTLRTQLLQQQNSSGKRDVEKQRRSQLKTLKKKYGLENERFTQKQPVVNSKYEDKAEKRRQKYGIESPQVADEAGSSVDSAISNQNVGHKLLEKMGWKSGESLGKTQTGIIEPIKVDLRLNASAGLGSTTNRTVSMDEGGNLPRARRKAEIRMKTQTRFEKAKTSAIFDPMMNDSDDGEDVEKLNQK